MDRNYLGATRSDACGCNWVVHLDDFDQILEFSNVQEDALTRFALVFHPLAGYEVRTENTSTLSRALSWSYFTNILTLLLKKKFRNELSLTCRHARSINFCQPSRIVWLLENMIKAEIKKVI